jgi:hypothetical protein
VVLIEGEARSSAVKDWLNATSVVYELPCSRLASSDSEWTCALQKVFSRKFESLSLTRYIRHRMFDTELGWRSSRWNVKYCSRIRRCVSIGCRAEGVFVQEP